MAANGQILFGPGSKVWQKGGWRPIGRLIVRGGLVADIVPEQPSFAVSEVGQVAGGRKVYVFPGLIDAHQHVGEEPKPQEFGIAGPQDSDEEVLNRTVRNLKDALAVGVTTVLDMGSFGSRMLRVRWELGQQIECKRLPRLLTVGGYLTRKGGHAAASGICVKYGEIEKCVSFMLEEGADAIKIMNDPVVFSAEEISAAVGVAHKRGKLVHVHAFTDRAAHVALDGRADVIEHAGAWAQTTLEEVAKTQTCVVPTFIAALDTVCDIDGAMNQYLFNEVDTATFLDWYRAECDVVPRLWASGIKIASGTDAGFPGTKCNSLYRELMALRLLGIPMSDVLRFATEEAASAVGLEKKVGSLDVGYSADFIVLESDPLEVPNTLGRPIETWVEGEKAL